jgi:hypothetical protein
LHIFFCNRLRRPTQLNVWPVAVKNFIVRTAPACATTRVATAAVVVAIAIAVVVIFILVRANKIIVHEKYPSSWRSTALNFTFNTELQFLNREPKELLQNNTLIETPPCHHSHIPSGTAVHRLRDQSHESSERLVAKGTGDYLSLLAEFLPISKDFFERWTRVNLGAQTPRRGYARLNRGVALTEPTHG